MSSKVETVEGNSLKIEIEKLSEEMSSRLDVANGKVSELDRVYFGGVHTPKEDSKEPGCIVESLEITYDKMDEFLDKLDGFLNKL